MLKLAVIGKDVSKSLSPQLHKFLLGSMGEECTYAKLSIPAREFAEQIEKVFDCYDAFNVTIPYKQTVISNLIEISPEAAALDAVNTVVCNGRKGFNTDVNGFGLMLESEGVKISEKRALVLGAGGAGRSCIFKLKELGAKVSVYEKDEARLRAVYERLKDFEPLKQVPLEGYDVIVNCTGVGMHETEGQLPLVRTAAGELPLRDEVFNHCSLAVDLIYEPAQSAFLKKAKSLGVRTLNGMKMLFFQAYWSDCIYLNRTPSTVEANAFFEEYQKENR